MSPWLVAAGRVQRRWPILQIVALVLLFLYGGATIDGFSSSQSMRSMLVLAALLGLAAAGQTLVVVLGGLDLSVPGLIVAGATLVSQLCGAYGWSLAPAVAVVAAIALALGATSGWICHRFQIQPLIVTLGMGAVALGGSLVWTKGQVTGSAPQTLSDLTAANGTTFGLQVSPVVVIWAVVAIVLGVYLHRTVAGRRLYLTGANPRAAQLALIRTRRMWVGVFAASALISAIVGVLLAGFAGADASIGDPYLFQGLAAVIVGGTALMGTRGDYTHTVVGALILTELTTILVGRGYGYGTQQMMLGALILVVVAGYGRGPRLRDQV